MINEAKDYKENEYTPKTWSVFMSTLKDAQKAVADTSSTQSKLDDLYTSLSNAMNALVHIADTTVLQSTIKEVEALHAKDYTETSWKAMMQVLTDAKAVLDDKNATQKAVNQAVINLHNAKEALVIVEPDTKPDEKPDTKPDTKPDEKPDTKPVIQDMVITNHTKSISVTGKFEEGTELITKELTQSEVQKLMNNIKNQKIAKDYTMEKAFQIELLKDGVVVKSNGMMTVRLKVNAALLKKDLMVVYIDDNGNITEMPTRKGKDYIEFDTTHNSTYAIMSKNTTTQKTGTDTGDHTHAGLFFGFLLLSAGAVVVLMKKRKA